MIARPPSIRDVAQHADVSIGTVSNVLNNPDRVAEGTRMRVLAVIDELGFVGNANARSLSSGRTRSIGLAVYNLANTMYVGIARGAQRAARQAGLTVMIADIDMNPALQGEILDFFDASRVAGVLLAPRTVDLVDIERLRRSGRPVVLLNQEPDSQDVCAVSIDNERVGYLAAQHLLSLGRTRLAFVGGLHDLPSVQRRLAGVRRAVREHTAAVGDGAVSLEEISTVDLAPPGGIRAGRLIVERAAGDRPDGIVAVADLLGMAVIGELGAAGIRVPEDIAVIGCDFNSAAWGGTIPLTSVAMRAEDVGYEGTRLLLEEVAGAPLHVHRHIVLEPEVVARESTIGRAGSPEADQAG